LTVCCNLRGTSEFIGDLIEDPGYAHEMLDYVTETSIDRIKAYRSRVGADMKPECGGLADDSIQLISTGMYVDMIMPYHRRRLDALNGTGPHGMHLCGDATRHFKTIRDELNVWSFDTGYPIDFGWVRSELGPDVAIQGGPTVPMLQSSSPIAVRDEVARILGSGICDGGRFILREANNLAPGIPAENLWAMWDAVHEFGRYDS
jgi:uroporphyrinogen-III decarboxylase